MIITLLYYRGRYTPLEHGATRKVHIADVDGEPLCKGNLDRVDDWETLEVPAVALALAQFDLCQRCAEAYAGPSEPIASGNEDEIEDDRVTDDEE